jgi:ligand-binding SRPBCC domain-containing protein
VKLRRLVVRQHFPLEAEELFPFFANAANLETITPPWLGFRILTPLPITMRSGAEIAYRLKLRGVPLGWRTRITAWEPPHRFVDEQVRGPYRVWRHEHVFQPLDDGTLMTDRVEYAHIGGPLVERVLVRPDVERIFRWRRTRLEALFGSPEGEPRNAGPTNAADQNE